MRDKDTKRTSFDLTQENSDNLKVYSEKMGSNFSKVLNYMLRIMLNAHPDVKKALADFCNVKIRDIRRDMESMSDFEKQDALQKQRQYQELAYFFSVGLDATQTRSNTMRKVYLKEGYLLIPNKADWIVLDNFSKPEECMYAGVVETREPMDGSKTYDAKHFVFFTDYKYGKDYPSDLDEQIYAACCEKDPTFKEVLNAVVEPDYGGKSEAFVNMTNVDAYKAAPCPGLFHIVEHGDPLYWNESQPDYEPPAGCQIIRN